jgi:TDG/mug DNA glycosylase family protein
VAFREAPREATELLVREFADAYARHVTSSARSPRRSPRTGSSGWSQHLSRPKVTAGVPLPPLLAKGLDVVFVGTEPGGESLRRQQYYADLSNKFYEHLNETNFTPRRFRPAEFRDLLGFGVGLDDVYDAPDDLRARLEMVAPRAVCFNSGTAFRRFAGLKELPKPWRQDAAGQYIEIGDALVWATSDSSFNANEHWPARLEDLRALRECVGS